MGTAGRKSANGVKEVEGGIDSEIDAIVEHVGKNGNCEFVRIMEEYSKMDLATMRKFLEYADKL